MRFTLVTRLPSPFGRKVLFAVEHLGMADSMRIQIADDEDRLRALNPLAKIPVLELQDGRILSDSRVILEFLDHLAGGNRIIPVEETARFEALRQAAISDGILEAALLVVYEGRYRPDQDPYVPWLAFQRDKIERALDALGASPPAISPVDVGAIGLACALEYLDFRQPYEWRSRHSGLVPWLDRFNSEYPFFSGSRPSG